MAQQPIQARQPEFYPPGPIGGNLHMYTYTQYK